MPDIIEMPGPEAARRDRWGWLLAALMVAIILVHGTQGSLDLLAKPGAKKGAGLNLSLADVAIGLAFFVWFVRRIIRLDFSLPPLLLPALGVLWLLLSLAPALKGSARASLTPAGTSLFKVFQFFEYFIAAYVVFWDGLREERLRRWAVRALFVAVAAALIAAAAQYFNAALRVSEVRGTWFEDRNTFGAFLALTVPLLYGVSVFSFSFLSRPWVTLLVIASLCLCLAGGPFLALVTGLLVVAILKGRFRFAMIAVLIFLVAGVLFPRLPRQNNAVLLDSVALYKESDPYRIFYVPEDGTNPFETVAGRLQDKQTALNQKIMAKQPAGFGDIPNEEDYSYKWQQRYKEWQSALNMVVASPLFGVGWGGYQANIGTFYGVPKSPKNLMEPNAHNGYLVWAASAGVPFLLIMFGLMAHSAKAAAQRFWMERYRFDQGLAAGLLGSLAALTVLCVFANPLVRGLGVTMALLFALAQALRSTRPEQPS